MTLVDHFWSLICLLILVFSVTNATPINRQVGISENVFITVQNDTYGIEQRVCSIDSMTYGDGETIPTSSPCEHCICRPPGFACTIISCEYRPGCKAFKRSNQCCPEYQCECEKDGRIYQNGEKIQDSNNPCEICYCQGGEIVCAVLDCYWRSDCQPRYIESRCCPLYDHCPPATNVGPFMRPISTTTVAPSFPWFNLSSAVYEVPHRTTTPPPPPFAQQPTPVPIFVTSRSTEETSSPTTPLSTPPPNPQPELVIIATEKIPIEVNIMATSQDLHEDEQLASVKEPVVVQPQYPSSSPAFVINQETEPSTSQVSVEQEHFVNPSQEPSNNVPVVEENTKQDDTTEVVQSTPALSSSDSTTVFAAPVIAISILPSPVEHILVTQEASLHQVANQVVQSEQNHTVVPDVSNEIGPVAITAGESIAHEDYNVAPTPTSHSQVDVDNNEEASTSRTPAFEPEPHVGSVIDGVEQVPTKQYDDANADTDPIQITTSAPNALTDLENVEITTAISTGHELHQQVETENFVSDTLSEQVLEDSTTVVSVPHVQKPLVEVPSTILSPPNRENIVPDVELVTIDPSSSSDVVVPSAEIQPPNSDIAGTLFASDDQQGDITTMLTITTESENVEGVAFTTVAPTEQPQEHLVSNLRDPVEDTPEELPSKDDIDTIVATTIAPTLIQNLEIEETHNFETAQNTVTEVVTDITTEHVQSEVDQPQLTSVLDESLPEHAASHDQPQPAQDSLDVTLAPSDEQEPVPATTTTVPEYVVNEVIQDDAVQINADNDHHQVSNADEEHEVAADAPSHHSELVAENAKESETVQIPNVHPSTNEVNSINLDAFEIIPPQSNNDANNVPEIQNQIMNDPHAVPLDKVTETQSNSVVDAQSDRNSDDDTIEIFAAHDEKEHPGSLKTENTTAIPPKIEQSESEGILQDDSVVIMAAGPDPIAHDEDTEDTHDEIMHPDDQHGSYDDIATTTQFSTQDAQVINDEPATTVSTDVKNEEFLDISHDDDPVVPLTTVSPDHQHTNDVQSPLQDETHDTAETEEQTTTSLIPADDEVQNDATESYPVVTTVNPVAVSVNKVQKVAESFNSNEETKPESKFRLDLSAFEHSGESGSREVQTQSATTPNEVVFSEVQLLPTNAPISEDDVGVRSDSKHDDVEAFTTFASVEKLSRDDVDSTTSRYRTDDVDSTTSQYRTDDVDSTTSQYRADDVDSTTSQYRAMDIVLHTSDKDAVESIKNFEFDEISSPATTNSPGRYETIDDADVTTSVTDIQTNNSPNNVRAEDIEQQTTIPSTKSEQGNLVETSSNDFIEVSTNTPSGFGAEYREELVQDQTTFVPSSFKSEAILDDDAVTTVDTPVFEDDVKTDHKVEAITNSPFDNKAKSDQLDDSITTLEPHFNDETTNEYAQPTTIATAVQINDTSTPRIISIDTMMIPEHGVSPPAFSDDIVRVNSDFSRSGIGPLEGENDSWFIQTAIKNRQIHGLFPSSRSQKRLFRSRTPRGISSHHNGSQNQSPNTKSHARQETLYPKQELHSISSSAVTT